MYLSTEKVYNRNNNNKLQLLTINKSLLMLNIDIIT